MLFSHKARSVDTLLIRYTHSSNCGFPPSRTRITHRCPGTAAQQCASARGRSAALPYPVITTRTPLLAARAANASTWSAPACSHVPGWRASTSNSGAPLSSSDV